MKKPRELDQETVNRILANAFAANEMKANAVPLEVLASYSNYRKERFTLQRVVVAVILLLFMMMPLLFVTPKCSMAPGEAAGQGRPTYLVSVDSLLPITRVTAKINEINMPVYETGANQFTVVPSDNGLMTIRITLLNDQSTEYHFEVTGVDTQPPKLQNSDTDDGNLNFYVKDEGEGVDCAGVYAQTMAGTTIQPIEWDEKVGRITFPYPTENMNIFFPDKVGNTLQVVVTLE